MKSPIITVLRVSVAISVPSVIEAWGRLGHETVALIAQTYLLPETVGKVQSLLNDTSSTYMANVALWADSYRYQAAGAFSAGFHFVNGKDGPPPDSCIIEYPSDCPLEGCIISAIANYTARVTSSSLSISDRAEALRFLIHFLGDITQPLHTEALGAGANNILVTFDGKPTNLHAAWDTSIPNKITKAPSTPGLIDSLGWANTLSAKVNSGPFKRDAAEKWLEYHDLRLGASKSATGWAQDANQLVCDYALAEGAADINGTEIGGEYYQGAVEVVESSIAKGGIRLAGWLNLVFEGRTGFAHDGCLL